jgi:hypothetical protein
MERLPGYDESVFPFIAIMALLGLKAPNSVDHRDRDNEHQRGIKLGKQSRN